MSVLETLLLLLTAIHFVPPVLYYAYVKHAIRHSYTAIVKGPIQRPKIAVIIPTYNEAALIWGKLDDIYRQDYPRDKLEVIVVDSGSTDGTPVLVEEWAMAHPDVRVRLIEEGVRRGKAYALNNALKTVEDADIVVITDVDSKWVGNDVLSNVAKYLLDKSIGAVTCVKIPHEGNIERVYRDFYNVLRLGESAIHSTPIFHGELAAFRRSLLDEIGGFPTDVGADDSHTATLIAVRGYRAIAASDIICVEAIPHGVSYHKWRVRRAQHLIQHFLKSLRLLGKAPRGFKGVLAFEAYLHVFNPLLLPPITALAFYLSLNGSCIALALLALGLLSLLHPGFRTWLLMQLYLLIALLKNAVSKELVWEKEEKRM